MIKARLTLTHYYLLKVIDQKLALADFSQAIHPPTITLFQWLILNKVITTVHHLLPNQYINPLSELNSSRSIRMQPRYSFSPLNGTMLA